MKGAASDGAAAGLGPFRDRPGSAGACRRRRRGRVPALALAAVLLAVLPAHASAGAQQAGTHRAMAGMAGSGWRMPPMNPAMPMIPGLEGAVPPVAGLDPAEYPPARRPEVLELQDGDRIELRAGLVRSRVGDRDVVMFAYNGQIPGPLLRAPTGATVHVHFVNGIDMPTTVHWHGLRLDNRFDGVPDVTQAAVAPGESFSYEVRFADSGVFWYHPHVREDIQQDLGLYGNLLAVPAAPAYWGPVHREEFLVLDDLLMDEHGVLPYGDEAPVHALMGRFGNVMLVNGTSAYELSVRRGEVVRFYLTNVANTRTFNVTFGGAPVKVVASDVGKYEHEEWVDSVPIAPAERYVVEVRFDDPGVVPIENTIQAIDHFRGEFYPHVDRLGTVRVDSEPALPDLSQAFRTLRENRDVIEEIDRYRAALDRPADHELELDLEVHDLPLPIVLSMEFERRLYAPPLEWNDTMPMMNWLATGKQVRWILRDRQSGRENMEIGWRFRQGQLVKLRIFNNPESFHPMHHPIHIHGQRYLVVARDGRAVDNLVWKDTAIVPVGSTVDLLVEMSNPGDWMMHCHIAEHLHAGMMTVFHVERGR